MLGTVSIIGSRKVRCPKCTAILTEPSTAIYQCPVCSTLLLAKGGPGDSNGRSSENGPPGNGRDLENTGQVSPPDQGSPGDANGRSFEKKLPCKGRHAESIQHSLEDDFKLEKAGVINDPAETCMQQKMGVMEKYYNSFEGSNGGIQSDSSGETVNDVTLQYLGDVLVGDQPLYRKGYHRPRMMQTDTFMPKVDASSSELPLYTPHRRKASQSSDRSDKSSDKRDRGMLFSELDSPSHDGSGNECDFSAESSENVSGAEVQEVINSLGDCKVYHLEENSKLDGIGEDEATWKEAVGDIQGHGFELSSLKKGTGNKAYDLNSGELVPCENNGHATLVDFRYSLKEQHPLEVSDVDELPKSNVGNESLASSGDSLDGQHPSEAADSRLVDRYVSSPTGGVPIVPEVDSEGTYDARCGKEITTQVSEWRRQQRQDAETGDSIAGHGDEKEDDDNSGVMDTLAHMARGSDLDANLPYTDLRTEKLSTEVIDSLDMSLCDWKSSQVSKYHQGLKEKNIDADSVDEKRVLDLDDEPTGAAMSEAEDEKVEQNFLIEDKVSVPHNHALPDSSSAVITQKDQIEKPPMPLRTAAMQKLMHRIEAEDTAQMDEFFESDGNIYTSVYDGDYGQLPSTSEIDQEGRGRWFSHNQQVNDSNGHFPVSKLEDRDVELPPSIWNEKGVTVMHPCIVADSCKRDENGSAIVQETDSNKQQTLTDASRGGCIPCTSSSSIPEPSSIYHHTDNMVVPFERQQMNDLEGVLTDVSTHQKPDSVDVHVHGLDINRRGFFVQPSRPLNSESLPQLGSAYAEWQEHETHLQKQNVGTDRRAINQGKFESFAHSDSFHGEWQGHKTFIQNRNVQTEINMMDQDRGYFFRDRGEYSGRSQESTTHNEQYPSDSLGLSQSTASSMFPPFPAASKAVMLSGPAEEQVFGHCAHHSFSPVCMSCIQSHTQQPNVQQMMQHNCAVCLSQATSMAYQPVSCNSCWDHDMRPRSYANSSLAQYQIGFPSPQDRRHNRSDVQSNYRALLARKHKHYPPLPQEGAAPYVFCQACNQLLQVPVNLPSNSGDTQKLRCGACAKVSKFSIRQQANNHSLIKMSRASSMDSKLQSIAGGRGKVHLVQPGITYMVHPEASIGHPSIRKDGRLLPKTNGYNERRHHVLGGMNNFGSGSHSQYEWIENQMLPQTNVSSRTISAAGNLDCMLCPRPITGMMHGQGLSRNHLRNGQGDSFLNVSGTNGESYFLSSPSSTSGSSPLRNASDLQLYNNHEVDVLRSGGGKVNNGIFSYSTLDEQHRPAVDTPSSLNEYLEKDSKEMSSPPPTIMQASLQHHYTENSSRDSLGRHQRTWTAESWKQQSAESDYSRSSSKGSISQPKWFPATPGSPPTDHFTPEFSNFKPGLQQRGLFQDSGNGIKSAPWSPAPGSPMYDHFTYDASSDYDERLYQRDRDAGRVHGPYAQDVSKGPKYFAGLFKKNLKEFGKGGQGNNNRRKVIVNGQLLPEAVIKKAEEHAGTIHSGSYWYDYQAGFWGPMGGPCLGIIPPFVEEFNFPLAKECAGGRTGILVNGRELHQKDLEVLAGRGLPTTPGKAYIVDITGRVVDWASGQQIRSLGKLAPSVERRGRGHGMFQPSAV